MKRTLILSTAICALLASTIYAFGDIARPKPTPAEGKPIFYTGLTIVPDAKSYEARLQISQETLKRIHAAAANNSDQSSMIQSVTHSSVRANAGPPGYIRWQNLPQALKDGKATSGGLSIEIVPGDDNMKLIIPLRNTPKPGEE